MRFSRLIPAALLALGATAGAQTPPCEAMVTGGATPPAIWSHTAQGSTETTRLRVADRYPICVYATPVARDLDITLRFQPRGGRMDRAGGLAVRVRDVNTFYVLRANAAESNVSLYHVTEGRRVIFASREQVPITLRAWHTLRLRLESDRFLVWFDGAPVLDARDGRISEAGRVALWSISDSDTLFGNPRVEVLR